MRRTGFLAIALTLASPSLCAAAPQDVTPALREKAIALCTDDAVRLCPDALLDESRTISCMAGKRRELTPACRVVYDQAARIIKK